MIKSLVALLPAGFAAPLHAHEGLALHGPLHRLLHAIGTDTAIALVGLPLVVLAVAALRRCWRTPADTAKPDITH